MENFVVIYDTHHGVFIRMNRNEFVETVICADKRRKAKHANEFTMIEFARMFGIRPTAFDMHVTIDKFYPISFEKIEYSLTPNGIVDRNVDVYTVTYQKNIEF